MPLWTTTIRPAPSWWGWKAGGETPTGAALHPQDEAATFSFVVAVLPGRSARPSESARVAVRNVRRDGMDLLKRLEKDHKISQDDQHTKGDELQKLTDAHIKDIDTALHTKEQEIMQV